MLLTRTATIFIIFSLLVSVVGAQSQPPQIMRTQDSQGNTVVTALSTDQNQEPLVIDVQHPWEISQKKFKGYIVQLKEPSLAEVSAPIEKAIQKFERQKTKLKKKLKDPALREEMKQQLREADHVLDTHNAQKKRELREKINAQKQKLQEEKARVKNKIGGIVKNIVNEFDTAFNGLVVDATSGEIATLESLPAVKSVTPNYEVTTQLIDSVPSIGANSIWAQDAGGNPCQTNNINCLTGRGIRIGIIDTGIDYTHLDLGGCFGTGCKVESGWDFVNNDANPMDDNGHGTHVAATAAGNGILKGVAPEATIYAYKVLDASGSGNAGGVIAAINRAIDPNQDGDFSDKLDVISLSLGGPGNPDDPTSQAIDNVVNNGVIAVVAAGNSGPAEGTINSPGTARRAITVGAVDKNDAIATFSSRGPTTVDVKPDIVAPGVAICAAEWAGYQSNRRCIDDIHIAISGTSMATPHVAGAVSLLKQKNPDWTPEEMKAALKTTAKNLGLRQIEQGAGLIDLQRLFQITTPPPFIELSLPFEIKGTVNIPGTITTDVFARYSLYYSSINSNTWTLLTIQNSLPLNNFLLENFDTTQLPDGFYIFKAVVTDTNGVSTDNFAPVRITNFMITSIHEWDILRLGDILEIKGWNYLPYTPTVQYGRGISPTSWGSVGIAIPQGNNIGDNIVLATFDTSVILSDGFYTIKITHGLVERKFVVYFDHTLRAGWPKKVGYGCDPITWCMLFGPEPFSPIITDINNDNKLEILTKGGVGSTVKIHAFEPDGTELPNWLVLSDIFYDKERYYRQISSSITNKDGWVVVSEGPHLLLYSDKPRIDTIYAGLPNLVGMLDSFTGCPSLLNIIGDDDKEIVFNDVVLHRLFAIRPLEVAYGLSIGQILPGWPVLGTSGPLCPVKTKEFVLVDAPGSYGIECTFARDFIVCDNYLDGKLLTAVRFDGTIKWQKPSSFAVFSFAIGNVLTIQEHEFIIALGQVDAGVGIPGPCEVRVYDLDGNILQGWPQPVSCRSKGLALADINDDSVLDIVTLEKIFKGDGTVIKNILTIPVSEVHTSFSVGDVNGDNKEDIVTQASGYDPVLKRLYSRVIAYDLNGIELFSKRIGHTSYRTAPAIADLDNDGTIEVITRDSENLYVWNLNSLKTKISWPMMNYDTEHTSRPPPLCKIETCNGKDDDCDGQIDELGLTYCGRGECERSVQKCANGQTQICIPGSPTTEICGNKIDDDCDGKKDNADSDCKREQITPPPALLPGQPQQPISPTLKTILCEFKGKKSSRKCSFELGQECTASGLGTLAVTICSFTADTNTLQNRNYKVNSMCAEETRTKTVKPTSVTERALFHCA